MPKKKFKDTKVGKFIIGKNGIEKIVEIELSDAEIAKIKESAEGVKKTNALLD